MGLNRLKTLDEILAGLPKRTPLQELGREFDGYVITEMIAENKRLHGVQERLGLPYRTMLFVDSPEGDHVGFGEEA